MLRGKLLLLLQDLQRSHRRHPLHYRPCLVSRFLGFRARDLLVGGLAACQARLAAVIDLGLDQLAEQSGAVGLRRDDQIVLDTGLLAAGPGGLEAVARLIHALRQGQGQSLGVGHGHAVTSCSQRSRMIWSLRSMVREARRSWPAISSVV